ncbi:unnamed protein product [Phytophthora lilii]|uniref:Unnamed protein product n=1 Tax=Phytophthora lilii TaxID=2077276 RepID=A0A9W6X8H5_9STRA|nr:unnamed protein product [Phytophthora lilii]
MLAKERKDWPTHVVALKNSLGKLPLTIGKVLEFVAKQKKMQNVEDVTVIFCVDGLQHAQNNITENFDLTRVLSSICDVLQSSTPFIVCVCSATVCKPISEVLAHFSRPHVHLLPPPLRGHEIVNARTRIEKQLVDDMGGHGRALEVLQQVMPRYSHLKNVDSASILDVVYMELNRRYNLQDLFTNETNRREVSVAILSRRRYNEYEPIGGTNMTVDGLRSFGLFRHTLEKRLECAFIIPMMLIKSIPKVIGEVDNFEYHITTSGLSWQRFEQFVAFYRRVKSIAFYGYPVLLSEFHAGARFGAIDRLSIHEEVQRTVVEAVNQLETKSGSKDSLICTNRHGSVDISMMSTVVINADHAAAGDIFMRVHLTDGNRQIHSNEVIQCKFTERNQKIDRAYYEKERAKAVNNTSDVFLLVTCGDVVEPFDLRKRCGIVSKAEFIDYFGPFASRAF